MNTLLKLEWAALFLAALYFSTTLSFPWWMFALLVFTPDLSMLGYLISNKIGAVFYNTFHHLGVAVALLCASHVVEVQWLKLGGTVLLAHSAFDRMLGYGLKYHRGFHFTHLGLIGNHKN